ncbi:MAG TPA: SHOCT domain-containing protein [Gaiellaceae bacterium]
MSAEQGKAPEAKSPPPAKGAAPAGRGRMITARILVVLAAITAVLALVAGYLRFQALDTDTFGDTARNLIADDTVRNQVATTLVNQLYANVDVEAELQKGLPADQKGLAGPLAGALRELGNRAAMRILAEPATQEIWVQAVTRAQRRLLLLLDNRGTFIRNENGQVVLDLRPLVVQVGSQVAFLNGLSQRLPPDAGRIRIMSANQLETAQKGTHLLKVVGTVFWVVPLILIAIAVWLARGQRRKMLRASAFSLLIAGFLVLVVRGVADRYVENHLVKTETIRPAASHALNIFTQLLADGAWTLIVVALVALIGVWLAGPTRSGTATRRAIAAPLARPEIAFGAVALIILLLLWWGPTPQSRRWYLVLAAAALLALGVEVLRRQTAREFPDAPERGFEWPKWGRHGGGGGDRLSSLDRLSQLKQEGALSDEEFAAEKARILGEPVA